MFDISRSTLAIIDQLNRVKPKESDEIIKELSYYQLLDLRRAVGVLDQEHLLKKVETAVSDNPHDPRQTIAVLKYFDEYDPDCESHQQRIEWVKSKKLLRQLERDSRNKR